MKVFFLRHGESEANVADFINDDPARNVSLTPKGEAQARAAAAALAGAAFSHAFASQLPRAQQTARIVLAGHGCGLAIDARLNERRSGMDGQPTRAFTELVAPDPVHIRPPAGESFLEQMDRLAAFLADLGRLPAEARVLAVSHENPILAARAVAGLAPAQAARGHLANCAWVVLAAAGGAWLEIDAAIDRG